MPLLLSSFSSVPYSSSLPPTPSRVRMAVWWYLGSIAFISPLDRGYLTQAPLADPLAAAIKRDMTAHAPNTALHQVCADVIKLLK